MPDRPLLHHRRDGRERGGDRTPLILGPSIGTTMRLWDEVLPALAADRAVIRYDLPGHGGSAAAVLPSLKPGAMTVADLAQAVLNLANSLGIKRFDYAGVSLGGAIGQQLALTVPDRIDRLAILASAARFPDPASWSARAEQVRGSGTEFLVPSRTGAWFTAAWVDAHPAETERLLAMLRATPPEGYAACCEAVGTFDVRDRLPAIAAPTLVLAGEHDPATTVDTVRLIAERVPGARFSVVPGAAHLPNATHPEAVNPLLLEHFA